MLGKNLIRPLIMLGIILTLLLSSVTVFAQGSDPTDDEVNAIAKELYCPVCENIPLDACGTAACEQWRGIIRDKLSEGWTEDQIKEYFVTQYGDLVLAEPPRRGFNLLIYLIPLLGFILGGYMLFRGFSLWRRTDPAGARYEAQAQASPPEMKADEYIQKVEEELQSRSRRQE
jgi:cytochrome c-type biogenesis protein CcmH